MPKQGEVRTTNGRGRLYDSILDTIYNQPFSAKAERSTPRRRC
jgi:hypothetical protein